MSTVKSEAVKKSIGEENERGRGAPSKYKIEYCEQLIEFFSAAPYEEIITEKGFVLKPNLLPAFHVFASNIHVCHDTLLEWTKHHPEFSEAYKKAKELQKYFLISNGLMGNYNPTAFIFVSKNITDMRDKQEVEHSGDVKAVMSDDEFAEKLKRANKILKIE